METNPVALAARAPRRARRITAGRLTGQKPEDSPPMIGRVPGRPNCLVAFGYGGNGITFSAVAVSLRTRARLFLVKCELP
jgi:glycine/D-amino acid oxidase-like deaminating enzyme